ncbi:heterokaryon incompatibility protein-domain-containing protein [Phyllosticta capitalensis]
MTADPFPYRRLEPDEIRIIQVLPLASNPKERSEVCCNLKHIELTDKAQYSALSYVWGDAQNTKPITVDGQRKYVTANLETALRRLASNLSKSEDERLDLWVDAICIDQANTDEKTLQVSMMDQIFNKATRTILWLGPSSRDCGLAVECLRWLSERRQKCFVSTWSQVQFNPEADGRSYTGIVQQRLEEVLAVICKDDSKRLKAIGAFLELPWFRRVWVLQEAALSRAALVMIGEYSLNADDFNRGFSMLCGVRDYLRIAGTGRQSLAVADFLTKKLGRATAIVMSRDAVQLRQLLHLLANPDAPLEASDERDFVFGMLGLATDAKRLGIHSDYSKKWGQIRHDVARAFLQHYDNFEVLSFCKASDEPMCRSESCTVPSWAPNWCPQYLARPLSVNPGFRRTRGEFGRKAYSASGYVPRKRVKEEQFLPGGVVSLTAVRIDVVELLGRRLSHPSPDAYGEVSKMTASLAAWLNDMKALLPDVNECYKTNDEVVAARWRTPIADRGLVYNYEMVRADPLLRNGYDDLISDHARRKNSRNAVRYADIARYKLQGRIPFRTCRGMIGIGPEEMRQGDCVWIIMGADLPFVLRPVDGRWSVVGEAYVHGVMDGEAMEMGLEKEVIHLV